MMTTMTTANPAHAEAKPGSQTILIVDDDPLLRAVLRRDLQEGGYTILEAGQGKEALQVSREYAGPIHLLITDVVLPEMGKLKLARPQTTHAEMNGVELARQVAAMRPETRVIFISGHNSDIIKRYGATQPESVFLQKPFAPDALARKVREVLDAPTHG
ncbi:MAG: response regulator [Nitrospirae bacterium]|nr:response regulator [Nitrospirota bacterium]